MAAHGHRPSVFEGRPIQAPGLMRHGPFHGAVPAGHRQVEPLPPLELLEKKVAIQEAEMKTLARENQRLAASHVGLRQGLVGTQQEMQRLQAHIGSIQSESDIQVRGLLEKIGKMEADIQAGEMVKAELQQAHLEAQRLITARQELTAKLQIVSEELQQASTELKKHPEMQNELEGLRQEHQNLRVAFEYEKSLNTAQVDQMRAMEKNLMTMAREVEKLRADVVNAEQRGHAPNQYGGTYANQDPAYLLVGQSSVHQDNIYSQVSGYANSGYGYTVSYSDPVYGQAVPAIYSEAYGRPQAPTSGLTGQVINPSASMNGTIYGRLQVQQVTTGTVSEGGNPYVAASSVASYDPARPPQQSTWQSAGK